jgi:hypothetical protein
VGLTVRLGLTNEGFILHQFSGIQIVEPFYG